MVPSDPFITTPTKEPKPLARPAETARTARELFLRLLVNRRPLNTACANQAADL